MLRVPTRVFRQWCDSCDCSFISYSMQWVLSLLGTQPKTPSCNKSVDILRQFVTTSRYQNAFVWLAMLVTTSLSQFVNRLVASCQNRLVASWLFQQACCNVFQQVVTSLQMTSCNKSDLMTDMLQLDEMDDLPYSDARYAWR